MPARLSARLSAELLQQIIDAARAALPNESVGLLVGDATPRRYVAMNNASASPYRYSIDPAEQLATWTALEDAGENIWGIVHSHVASAAVPSATDIEQAFYPDSLYLICSLADPERPTVRAWSIRAWTISDGAASEVPVVISN